MAHHRRGRPATQGERQFEFCARGNRSSTCERNTPIWCDASFEYLDFPDTKNKHLTKPVKFRRQLSTPPATPRSGCARRDG
jgi:hypothetical protein